MDKYRNMLFNDLVNSPDYYFLAGYFSILGSLNLAGIDQQEVRKAIDYAAKECYIPWENLPMAGSMVEMSGFYPPGSAHQIRPQMFTMGAWFGAMGNLGVKRLPYGLTVQPAQLITGIKSYAYNDKILDFSCEGEGNAVSYSVNGTAIKGSLQIPEQKLANGNNIIEVKVSNVVDELPLLLNSTMKLNSIDHSNEKTSYHFESLNAENSLTISLTGNPSKIQLKNTKGKSVKFNTKPLNKSTYQVNFSYKGGLVLEVRK